MRELSPRCLSLLLAMSTLVLCACGDDPEPDAFPSGWPGANLPGSSLSPGSSGGGSKSAKMPPGEYCAEVASWDASWVQRESEVLDLVNAERARGATCGGKAFAPTGPLSMDGALQCAARHHSKNMSDQHFFSHTGPEGDDPGDRMKWAGYTGGGWGENIAGGSDTPKAAMESWMDSPGHCSNIMNPSYKKIGVGYHPDGDKGHLWTQTFGG